MDLSVRPSVRPSVFTSFFLFPRLLLPLPSAPSSSSLGSFFFLFLGSFFFLFLCSFLFLFPVLLRLLLPLPCFFFLFLASSFSPTPYFGRISPRRRSDILVLFCWWQLLLFYSIEFDLCPITQGRGTLQQGKETEANGIHLFPNCASATTCLYMSTCIRATPLSLSLSPLPDFRSPSPSPPSAPRLCSPISDVRRRSPISTALLSLSPSPSPLPDFRSPSPSPLSALHLRSPISDVRRRSPISTALLSLSPSPSPLPDFRSPSPLSALPSLSSLSHF